MVHQNPPVQLQHWLGEHTHSQVNETQLHSGEPLAHVPKQVPRHSHIVLAVAAVVGEFFRCEVFAEVVDVLLDLLTLDTDTVVLTKYSQAPADLSAMQCAAHRQRVQPALGFDAKVVAHNEPIEHSVVR